jgi:AraC family transcriptional regulator of adaptative response/methylated-DNA-[protein]-cysteine methyltransferase
MAILAEASMKTVKSGETGRSRAEIQKQSVQRACRFIESYGESVPKLAEIAAHVGMSPTHFQKLFTRLVGISPRDYADSQRVGRVKSLLREGDDVTGALYEAGYGSSSRLYEKSDQLLGMTPATYRKGGAGARMAYSFSHCPLNLLLVAATERGICFIAFGDEEAELLNELRAEFPAAEIVPDQGILEAWTVDVLRMVQGHTPSSHLPLDVQATAFQRQVWQALTDIPLGETRTYSEIAASLGKPTAQRAVGRACATNPVSIVIPCHRAIRGDGGLAGYRWGLERKKRLIETEQASVSAEVS